MLQNDISPPTRGNVTTTAILDFESHATRMALKEIGSYESTRKFVQQAHRYLVRELRPTYSVRELQPASKTFQMRMGSCSQRLACLESFSRAAGVATRVRAFQIDGKFWSPRFQLLRPFLPHSVLLVWPQFWIEERWIAVDELYCDIETMVREGSEAFSNDAETLFEAIGKKLIDFSGAACAIGCPRASLSHFVKRDLGIFTSRDEVFAEHGSLENQLSGRLFNLLYEGRSSSRWCAVESPSC
jgi:hypothetical protein